MLERLIYGSCLVALITCWLVVALVAWLILYHPLALILALLAIFAVYVLYRRRGSLAGPRH